MSFSEKLLTVPPPVEVAGRHIKRYHVTADPAGRLVWASAALLGSTHDLTAARTRRIIEALIRHEAMTSLTRGVSGRLRRCAHPVRAAPPPTEAVRR